MAWPHIFTQRIYTAHTDTWGIVYHAHYLAFAEAARTELFRSLGFPLSTFTKTYAGYFVVAHIDIKFIKPSYLDDLIAVYTTPLVLKPATLTLEQAIKTHETDVHRATATIKLAWVGKNGKPQLLPAVLVEKLRTDS